MEHLFLISDLFAYFLCLCRVVGMILLIPLFSQKEFISQSKMGIAVMLALFITPLVHDYFPKEIDYGSLFFLLIKEFSIGLFIGLTGRILFLILDIVGHIIGAESGLSNATIFNPTSHGQAALPSLILSLGATVFLFTLNFHHVLIKALVESYTIFQSDHFIVDSKIHLINIVHKMFSLGLQFSYPFLIVGIILNFSLGLVNKIIPQIQLFSVIMPVQIFMGVLIMTLTITEILKGFSTVYVDVFLRG